MCVFLLPKLEEETYFAKKQKIRETVQERKRQANKNALEKISKWQQ